MKPRNLLIGAALLTLLTPYYVEAHCHIPRHCPRTFAIDWNEGNIEGMLERFEGDADFYAPSASFVRGDREIRDLLVRLHETTMRGSNLELDERPLRERQFQYWALVDFEATLVLEGGERLRFLLSAVSRRPPFASEWSFTSLRMIPLAEEPD